MKQQINEIKRMQELAGLIEENLTAETGDGGIQITGFPEPIDSLFLTLDKSVHDEMISEPTTSAHGTIKDTSGITVYWSFGHQ
jgi:hypothetical protein